jgi:hypothetical protein
MTGRAENDVSDKSAIAKLDKHRKRSNPMSIERRNFQPLVDLITDRFGNELHGVNWCCWHNSILADEMGFGGTAQLVSTLNNIALRCAAVDAAALSSRTGQI